MEPVAILFTGNYGLHPDSEYPELGRYFSRRRSALYSLRADGSTWCKRLYHGWRIANPTPAPEGIQASIDLFNRIAASGQPWQRRVDDIPTLSDLEEQLSEDGSCETPTGHQVEPDGCGPDGVPSWLRVFGMV